MMGLRRYLTAQVLMEYVLLIAIIVTAMVVIYPRVKRTSQSMMKTAADQVGDQAGAEQDFTGDMSGYVVGSNTVTGMTINNLRRDTSGTIDKSVEELTTTRSGTLINSGFTKE